MTTLGKHKEMHETPTIKPQTIHKKTQCHLTQQTNCYIKTWKRRSKAQNQSFIQIYLMWQSRGVWQGRLLELKAPLCDLPSTVSH